MVKKVCGLLLVAIIFAACGSKTDSSNQVDSTQIKKEAMVNDSISTELQKHIDGIDSVQTELDKSLNDIK